MDNFSRLVTRVFVVLALCLLAVGVVRGQTRQYDASLSSLLNIGGYNDARGFPWAMAAQTGVGAVPYQKLCEEGCRQYCQQSSSGTCAPLSCAPSATASTPSGTFNLSYSCSRSIDTVIVNRLNTTTLNTATCPDGGTYIGLSGGKLKCQASACVAPTVQQSDGTCKTPCAALKGQATPYICTPFSASPTAPPSNTAFNGCKVTFTLMESSTIYAVGQDVQRGWCGVGSYTGVSANNDETVPVPPTAPPTRCTNGQCPGTVNGAAVCVPCSDTNPTTRTTTSSNTNTAGQTTTSTSTSVDNGQTTTTTTRNSDGSSSTTVTVNPSPITVDLSGIKTDCDKYPNSNGCKTVNEIQEYCSSGGNANKGICKDLGNRTASGTCNNDTSALTCDGDAIDCAIARATQGLLCTLTGTSTTATLGQSIAAGNDPVKNPAANSERQNINLPTSIDQSRFLNNNGLQDLDVPVPQLVSGAPDKITIPFSAMNTILSIMGNIAVAFALILAARILSKE